MCQSRCNRRHAGPAAAEQLETVTDLAIDGIGIASRLLRHGAMDFGHDHPVTGSKLATGELYSDERLRREIAARLV